MINGLEVELTVLAIETLRREPDLFHQLSADT